MTDISPRTPCSDRSALQRAPLIGTEATAAFIKARSQCAASQTHSGLRSKQWHWPLITWPQPKPRQHRSKSPCPAGAIHTWSEDNGEGPGTYCSSSVTSSSIRCRQPPQSAQASVPGVSSTSIREMWSGIGRRFGLSFSSMSGSFNRAVMAAAAISLVRVPAGVARPSRTSCRTGAPGVPPADGAFVTSIRLLDGLILLRRTAPHSRSGSPAP